MSGLEIGIFAALGYVFLSKPSSTSSGSGGAGPTNSGAGGSSAGDTFGSIVKDATDLINGIVKGVETIAGSGEQKKTSSTGTSSGGSVTSSTDTTDTTDPNPVLYA